MNYSKLICSIVLFVCIEIISDVESENNAAFRDRRPYRCRGWWWKRGCPQCTMYNPTTHTCCKTTYRGCCYPGYLHSKPMCNSGISYQEHPCLCQYFYQCYNNTLTKFKCPFRGYWDSANEKCAKVMSDNRPRCRNRAYRRSSLPGYYVDIHLKAMNGSNVIANISDIAPANDVYNVMLHLQGKRVDFSFQSKYSDKFWNYIQCINGVCAENGNYWAFSVNGKESKLGVNSVIAYRPIKIGFDFTSSE